MTAAKPSAVPIEQNHSLLKSKSAKLQSSDIKTYRRLVGRLIYLTITRPDLSYTVHILSQFLQQPQLDHLDPVFKAVRYLKQTPGQGLFFSANNNLELNAFCDAGWGGCHQTRASLTGYCLMFGNDLVSWKCKKQHTVSRSSCEAEYRAMSETCCEIAWLISL